MNPRKASVIIFRIVYSSSYTVFLVALLLLIAVTPGDHIYQTVSNHKLGNVFVVGGTYLLTGLIAVFIYASRLYTNRTTLAAIPKPYLPIENGEVGKNVHKMIVKNRQRSALIALQSRPRPSTITPVDRQRESNIGQTSKYLERVDTKLKGFAQDAFIRIDPEQPPWGQITHPGWSGPASGGLSNLEFNTVIVELANLIEARAVSLAPLDYTFEYMSVRGGRSQLRPSPDSASIAQLQRSPSQGLRDYLDRLQMLEIITSREAVDTFLTQYEYARFSTHALLETEFRTLMIAFSNLFASMKNPEFSTYASKRGKMASKRSESGGEEAQESVYLIPSVSQTRRRGLEAAEVASMSSLSSSQSVIHHNLQEVD